MLITHVRKVWKKYKNVIKDFILNILASGVFTMILQLLVYPVLASKVSASEYGTILTMMGLQNTVINAMGNALNNVRLIQNDKYDYDQNGDFNIILFSASLIAICVDFFVFRFGFRKSYDVVLGLMVAAILGMARLYYCAAFRLIINLKKMLICNCITALGYILGVLLYYIFPFWPVIFIVGEAVGVIFLVKKSFLFGNNLAKSKNFKSTVSKYRNVCCSTAIGSAITYMDRIIILPILGAAAVSTYTVASIVGKMMGMVMLPIAGVMLSYYSQKGFSLKVKGFQKSCFLIMVVCSVFYLGTLVFGGLIINIFYPTLARDASCYMGIANLAAIVSIYGNMLSPTVLKFCSSAWQIIITGIYAVIYAVLAVVLSLHFGLSGFCWSSIVANVCRNILMMIVGYKGVKSFETQLQK